MIPDEIERVALLGWRVAPTSSHSRAACIKDAAYAATSNLDQIKSWCREFPDCSWRVIFQGSGIWAIDLDIHGDVNGIHAFSELVRKYGPVPPRPMTRSGGGGMALFFRFNCESIVGKTGFPRPGIDPRRGKQSVTIPPSRHSTTGKPYVWLVKPWEISPPDAPKWLLKLLEPTPEPPFERRFIVTTDQARRRLYRAAEAILQAHNGQRNDVLNRRAFQVGQMVAAGFLSEQEGIDALYGAARQAGLQHNEIKATLRSGFNAGLRRPTDPEHVRR